MERVLTFRTRVEQWFADPEVNAAGRMGLYRILYGIWFLWLSLDIDFGAMAARPTPPPEPIGIIKIWTLTPVVRYPETFTYWLAFLLGVGLVLLTFGLATRISSIVVFLCSATLFAWDSSYGRVIDHYVLFGTIVPFWMSFSRWGETYSLDALIRRVCSLPVPSPSDSSWKFVWPQRAVIIFTVILYFSAGYTKMFEGTWLHNPYVVLDKLTKELVTTLAQKPDGFNELLYRLTLNAPIVFIVGQYITLVFELLFPVALINRELRTLVFSGAAVFHILTTLVLEIAFAPMIIVLAIIVDWQSIYERFLPVSKISWAGPSKAPLVGSVGLILSLAIAFGWLLAVHSPITDYIDFLPRQEWLWFLIAPFAVVAALRSSRLLYISLQARFLGT